MPDLSDFRTQLLELLPRLRRFALALSGNPADAEDLVQAAVEKALNSQESFRRGTRMDSWAFKILQNLFIDERRSRRTPLVELEAAADVVSTDGRDVVRTRRRVRTAQEALAELPLDQRAVLSLVLIDGASYREAAEILDVPVGTVMSRLARGRAAVIAFIQRREPQFQEHDA